VLTVDHDGLVRVWDASVGHPVVRLDLPATGATRALGFTGSGREVYGLDARFSPGSSPVVASASIVLWSAATGRRVGEVALPGLAEGAIACSTELEGYGIIPPDRFGELSAPATSRPGSAVDVPLPRHPADPYAPGYAPLATLVVAVRPDGREVAYATGRAVEVVNPEGRRLANLAFTGRPIGLEFVPNPGDASGGNDDDTLLVVTTQAVELWQPGSARPDAVAHPAGAPVDAEVSASGTRLATAGADGEVEVWDARTGERLATFRPPSARFNSPLRVALDADGMVVAAGTDSSNVYLWGVRARRLIATKMLSTPWAVVELDPSLDGSDLLAVDYPQAVDQFNGGEGAAEVLNASTGAVVARYASPPTLGAAPINPGAALSPNGGYLFAGSLGLAPSPPGGTEAAYQISSRDLMESLQSVVAPLEGAYVQLPAQPWSPDGAQVLVGNAIYSTDACGSLAELEAAASARLAWSQPLSAADDHPPAASPYT